MNKRLALPLLVISVMAAGFFAFAEPAHALPFGFEVETITDGLILPTAVTFTPDGRIFIAEKAGAVRIYKNGALLPTPLIQLTDVNTFGDKGLIGMAVDPDFSNNGFLYLLYTYENTPGTSIAGPKTGRLVRVTVIGDIASESSKQIVLGSVGGTLDKPSCEDYLVTRDCIPSDTSSHSVGGLRFGPDGYLYVSLGDGAHFDYVDERALRAQNLDSLAGKILRLNTQGVLIATEDGEKIVYGTAPSSNPFYTGNPEDNRSKVWALGVRNAYRFNFRPSNGSLYVSDVGWSTWEEINTIAVAESGKNFGWPCREGFVPSTSTIPVTGTIAYDCVPSSLAANPLYAYEHNAFGAGSVTGGAFGTGYPDEYDNAFFFGDYAQNYIKILRVDGNDECLVVDGQNNCESVEDFYQQDFANPGGPVEFVTGPEGYVYYLAIYNGELRRISYTLGNRQPTAQISATPTSGLSPLFVEFKSDGSDDPDLDNPVPDVLTYEWNFGDGSPVVSDPNPEYTYLDDGVYTAVLTLRDDHGGVNKKSVTITVGNQAPVATIVSPSNGSLYIANQIIQASGVGVDPEGGSVSLKWEVILHHNVHTHPPFVQLGPELSYPVDDHELATDIHLEVKLIATDLAGLIGTTSINLYLNNSGANVVGNLILNPSVEVDGVAGRPPEHWSQGGYGNNTRAFSIVPGHESDKALKITVSDYVNGDGKWFPDPMYVVPDATYTFSDYYIATAPTTITAQLSCNNGIYAYQLIAALPVTATWQQASATFQVTPNEVCFGQHPVAVSLFHQLSGNGELTTDNFSLRIQDIEPPVVTITSPTDGQIVSGTITVTANASDNLGIDHVHFLVDGNVVGEDESAPYEFSLNTTTLTNGAHVLTAEAHDLIGLETLSAPRAFTVSQVAPPPDANLILNPSLENETVLGTPDHWLQGTFGANDAVFTYPTTGQVDAKAATIAITAYADGDAKWFFDEVPVIAGQNYVFQDQYTATTDTTVTVRYTKADTSFIYEQIGTLAATQSDEWKSFEWVIRPPEGVVSLTVFHSIQSVGILSVDGFALNIATADTNLILNPSFEAGVVNAPTHWLTGGFGTNTTAFTYPVDGANGSQSKGAHIEISNYVDGDAKWYFEEVAVTPGHFYAFSNQYKSSATSSLTARYTKGDTLVVYETLAASLPATADWETYQTILQVPADVVSLTIFHSIQSDGSLAVDNYSLVDTANPTIFDRGLVSLTFDDGWSSIYDNAIPVLDAARLKSTQYIISRVMQGAPPTNFILNGNLEDDGVSAPTHWFQGTFGNNNATYTYPAAGDGVGNTATRVEITEYTDGDAKWYFEQVEVTPGQDYIFSDRYISTIESDVIAQFTYSGGATSLLPLVTLPSSATWQSTGDLVILVPDGAEKLTVIHRIQAPGSLTTDDFSLTSDIAGRVSMAQVLAMQANGHDIGVHTRTHPSMITLTPLELLSESGGARRDLILGGATPVDNFAYPYGNYNAAVKQAIQDAGFLGARSVDIGYNTKNGDRYALKVQQVGVSTTVDEVKSWIDSATANKTWLILMFHQVSNDGTPYSITQENLVAIVEYLKAQNTEVVTVSEGLQLMNAGPVLSPDAITPVITLVGNAVNHVALGGVFTDLGAEAIDNVDGNITSDIVVGGVVNTAVAGTYQLTYNVSDLAGNDATQVVRTIIVEAPAPVISSETSPSASTNSITITWTTDHPSTSRVVYDTVSHPTLGIPPNYGYAFSTVEDATLTTSHSVSVTGLSSGTTYFLRSVSHGSPETVSAEITKATQTQSSSGGGGGGGGGGSFFPTPITQPTVPVVPVPVPPGQVLGEETTNVTAEEQTLLGKIDMNLVRRLAGRILLQVERFGQAWYLDPLTLKKYYLANGNVAYSALRKFGLGITNADLAKIPVGHESRFAMTDADNDGLPDKLEEALGTDANKADTDGDGVSDGVEVLKNKTNPKGVGKLVYSSTLANKLKGRILLQVESKGEAWYVNPVDGKRYYMNSGEAAYQIMRYLSLGITNVDIRKIPVGDIE